MSQFTIGNHIVFGFEDNKYYLQMTSHEKHTGCCLEEHEIPIYLFQALANWHNALNNTKTVEELIADNQLLTANLDMQKRLYESMDKVLKTKNEIINEARNTVYDYGLQDKFSVVFPDMIEEQ